MAVRVLKKNVIVNLADIETNMFVRQQLDYEHVRFLSGLIDAGTPLANIQVIPKPDDSGYIMFDGRHRKEAFILSGQKKAKVDFVSVNSEIDFIAEAFKANLGGSRPPTPADTEHTITLLVEREEPIDRISKLLGLPASMVRKYVQEVKSRLNRAKLQRAAAAVVDGSLNVSQAAEKFKVDSRALKQILSGRTKKKDVSMLKAISSGYKSVASRNYKFILKMIQSYEDGDVTEKEVTKLLDHIENLQQRASETLQDWRKRFELKIQKAESA